MKDNVPPRKPDPQAIPVSLSLDTAIEPDPIEEPSPPINKRVLTISLWAMLNAMLIGVIAKGLVLLIDLITNLAFFGRLSVEPATPGGHHLGWIVIIIPVIGGLIVGLMARYGSTSIRGHGIPEAMEQVLTNRSRISPITTFLKPLSAAIAIGTGGPFGAEGPIIATGGAFGSLTGQFGRVTSNERKILLTAGACAGMAAIFGSPLAAILLAIELLLFEFSPRSIIPVALSCITGAALHIVMFGSGPVFSMPPIPEPTELASITYVGLGLLIGVIAVLISKSVYFVEDMFDKLPLHWMWWPAIGAIVVGVVGYFDPRTMGVGYDNIKNLLGGVVPVGMLVTLSLLKFASWVFSLGSGTSGGTLAPLLTIGGSIGALLGLAVLAIFPDCGINIQTAAMVGMAATFAGASRALLTSIVFVIEATGQMHGLVPVLGASTVAYFVSFVLMRGSIMTEKIERRGVRAPHSYQPDVLEFLPARMAMYQADRQILHAGTSIAAAREQILSSASGGLLAYFIVLGDQDDLRGIICQDDIMATDTEQRDEHPIESLIKTPPPFIYAATPLSTAVDVMARNQTPILPVVDNGKPNRCIGILSHNSILNAYSRHHRSENREYGRILFFRRRGMRLYVRTKQQLKN